MLPGFGAPEIRSFLPLFLHYSGEASRFVNFSLITYWYASFSSAFQQVEGYYWSYLRSKFSARPPIMVLSCSPWCYRRRWLTILRQDSRWEDSFWLTWSEAAFDYQFGAMEHADNPLSKAYFNLLFVCLYHPCFQSSWNGRAFCF